MVARHSVPLGTDTSSAGFVITKAQAKPWRGPSQWGFGGESQRLEGGKMRNSGDTILNWALRLLRWACGPPRNDNRGINSAGFGITKGQVKPGNRSSQWGFGSAENEMRGMDPR